MRSAERLGALGHGAGDVAEGDEASVWPIRRGICSSCGRPSVQRPSRTMRSCSISRRWVARISIIAWSATSSMKVSGQLVTGMPFAVAAATSTESTPTLPSAMILQRSQPVDHRAW